MIGGQPAGAAASNVLKNVFLYSESSGVQNASLPGTMTPLIDGTTVTTQFTLQQLGAVSTTGTYFKDMGRTVVSSGIYFRKLQYVNPASPVTNGVVGLADSTNPVQSGYCTFYIRLSKDGQGATSTPFNVARL